MSAQRPRATDAQVDIPRGHLLDPLPRPAPGPMADDPRAVDPLELLREGFRGVDAIHVAPDVRRALGRAMAAPAGEKGVAGMLQAFAALRLGEVHLVSATADRFVFESRDLHSASIPARQPACHMAAGFVEGVVEVSTRGLALGSEVSCRARGDAACRFVVRATRTLD